MTLLELEQQVYRYLNKAITPPDPVTKTRVDGWLNDRYRELLRLDGINLRDESVTLTTESGRPRYALPATVTQIYNVVDTANQRALQQRTLGWIRQRDPSEPASQLGTPRVYAILNEAGIGQQPTNIVTNALRLISTQGADIGTVTLEFAGPAGGFNSIALPLTGVTPVIVPPAIQHVFRMYMAAAPVGTVELFQASPALTLARIPNGSINTATLHAWVIHFWPTPTSPLTYTIDMARPRRSLIALTDEPAIPEEFHDLLVWGAVADELLKLDDTRAQTFFARWNDGVRRLRAFLHQSRGQRWIPRSRPRGYSDLPPGFPAEGGW